MESGTAETSTETNGTVNGAERAVPSRSTSATPRPARRSRRSRSTRPRRVAATVARVRANQADWEAIGIEGRYHWLGKLRDWLLDNHERVSDTMQPETGKVRADAADRAGLPRRPDQLLRRQGGEVHRRGERPPPLAAAGREEAAAPVPPLPGGRRHQPLELPAGRSRSATRSRPCRPAPRSSIKPSEFTPLGLTEIVEAWKEEIGGPDVLDCVQGTGETGGALIDDVDFIQFTGSDRTGRKVMARAAETLTPVSLELGGKDPMIVLADADLDRAANAAAWGGMVNSGQICISVERIYVEEPVYDEFVAKLTEEVGELRQGADGREPEKDVGAMTSPNQTAIVEDQVDDALAAGARALTGGKRVEGPGDYFEPTVLVDVDHSMKVMRDETFGPVVGVMKVRDSEEALRLANDTRYGLSASVFGEKDRAERVARRIECRRGQRQRRDRQLRRRWTCRWAAGSSPGSAIATASTGSRSTAARSRSSSPASAPSASRPGTRTPRRAAASSPASPEPSTRTT